MSSAEESPAQKAARLRRERREAKIKDGGTARLDKITSMGGRTPVSAREESSPSPQPQPQTQPSPPAPTDDLPIQTPSMENQSPEAIQAQQEYLRALLRQSGPPQPQPDSEDPTMKLLSSLLGGVPPGEQGTPPTPGGRGGAPGPGPGLSQAELASSLGVPPFLTKLLGAAGSQPQSEEAKSQIRRWKFLHVIFAITVAVYLLSLIGSSITTYGSRPPPPATVQNPFMLFVTGELLLSGGRVMMRREGGVGLGVLVSVVRDVVRDGSLVLFLLGMGTWWHGGWMTRT